MPEVKIVRIAESFRIDEAGQTKTMKSIMYNIGTDGPFTFEVPVDEFDPDKVLSILNVEAEKIAKLRGIS